MGHRQSTSLMAHAKRLVDWQLAAVLPRPVFGGGRRHHVLPPQLPGDVPLHTAISAVEPHLRAGVHLHRHRLTLGVERHLRCHPRRRPRLLLGVATLVGGQNQSTHRPQQHLTSIQRYDAEQWAFLAQQTRWTVRLVDARVQQVRVDALRRTVIPTPAL